MPNNVGGAVTALEYDQAGAGASQVVYHDDGSYIEYSYQDGSKNIGEAAVQVEYIGTADVSTLDGNVEYVTVSGEQEGEEQRVIGVLRDGGLATDYGQYYTIRADDPIQAALNTAEVDRVDLMQFQVLNSDDVVYERDIGPPPPLFEDPNIIKVCQCENILNTFQ